MGVLVRMKGEVAVLVAQGKLTHGTDRELRELVAELLEQGHRRFVLNLRGVSFIDSMGLSETVACTKRIRERGGAIRLVLAESGHVVQVLRITGLLGAYETFADEERAVADWSS